MPNVFVTRRLTFNAAHRVYNPQLTDQENDEIFGKCNNPNWHGHNYVLEITVSGPVDPRTGYVIDLARVKAIVQQEVVELIDHRNINVEVEFMKGVIPTTENIAVACWRVLRGKFAPGTLHRIKLWETENHYVEYYGD
jgi:6-pyruvoyltetrahydropterin/6-carboxytetrahydropterin synthase